MDKASPRLRGRAGVEQRKRRLSAHPLCAMCQSGGIVRAAEEVDHIVPLALGGEDSDDNVQGICVPCHKEKSAAEGAGYQAASNHPEWLSPSAIPLTIVCGPPASGKTTYVGANAGPSDIVIDLDVILCEISPGHKPWHIALSSDLLNRAIRRRNAVLANLSRHRGGRAWFIVSAPTAEEREWWLNKLGGTLVLLDPGRAECIRRAKARGTPSAIEGIRLWHERAAQPWRKPKARIGIDGWPE